MFLELMKSSGSKYLLVKIITKTKNQAKQHICFVTLFIEYKDVKNIKNKHILYLVATCRFAQEYFSSNNNKNNTERKTT